MAATITCGACGAQVPGSNMALHAERCAAYTGQALAGAFERLSTGSSTREARPVESEDRLGPLAEQRTAALSASPQAAFNREELREQRRPELPPRPATAVASSTPSAARGGGGGGYDEARPDAAAVEAWPELDDGVNVVEVSRDYPDGSHYSGCARGARSGVAPCPLTPLSLARSGWRNNQRHGFGHYTWATGDS